MRNSIYRVGIRLVPRSRLSFSAWTGEEPRPQVRQRLLAVLNGQRVRGGTIALSDGKSVSAAAFGVIRMDGKTAAAPDTFYRAASVSKFVTAYGALRLHEKGRLSLDEDIGKVLGFPVRNPRFPDTPVTLAMLLSHTSSIRDGDSYQRGLSACPPVPQLLQADCFSDARPGETWDYSNLGAGIAGCVMEAALHRPFDLLMRETLFAPLGIRASYLPGRVPGILADAWRLFPPDRRPGYDARERQKRPFSESTVDPERDYLLAHGSLCIRAIDLLRLGQAAVRDNTFALMRQPRASFGARDPNLREGLGTFLYDDPSLPETLYGHQGLAYGAVHGLFVNERAQGFALLTSSASEERAGVMTELNRLMCRALFDGGECAPW